jgi:adenylate cyclase
VYISEGAVKAAEKRALAGTSGVIRADEQVMAVMFSDICGFTNMSSTMQPRQVIELLNDYFDRLCPIVKEHGGDIDKFIGDCIMAVFGELPGHEPAPVRAVRAAMAMQAAMPAFNATHGAHELQMRIGLNTGPLVRGDMGASDRRDYTVIGDTVNRANRYEANAPKGGVLISASTLEVVKDLVEVEPLPGLKLKGLTAPVTGYVVKSITARSDADE